MKTRKIFYFLAILCVLFCLLPIQVRADTLEVGPFGYPYTSIQAAIDAAINGDTVLVHDGTYVENISISGKTITVLSDNGPGDTIIDGDGSGNVVYLGSGDSTLEGFTIQNGASMSIGGGIYCFHSSPTINNCTIADNIARSGGGIYCSSSSPAITDCRILRNATGNGGGIFCTGSSSPTITHCIIDGNFASGGALFGYGGGIYCEDDASPTISNSTISNNSAESHTTGTDAGWGGGIYCMENSSLTITNSIISGNTAVDFGGFSEGKGGGIYCDAILSMTNCVVANNTAGNESTAGNGGGIYCWWDSSVTITNCTIAENKATLGAGVFYHACLPTVVNSILWDNTPDAIGHYVTSGSINITYSDIEGGYTGEGNINTDPLFADAANGDFHLKPDSPCIDEGNNGAAGVPDTDFEGDQRIVDGDNDGTPTVDMGADEVTEFILEVGPSGYPYTTIRAAIDDAVDGAVVLVHDGTYVENINFSGKAITIRSENGAGSAIIDGNANGSVISFRQGEGAGSVLDGFTLRKGSETSGGGISCYNSSPTISNCIVVENTATYLQGGGIYCYNASPTITNCIIARNRTENTGALCGGGGIGCYNSSSPVLTNCTIYGNTTVAQGGAIICTSSSATVVNSILWGNSADESLDQIYLYSGSSIDIRHSNVQQGGAAYPGMGNINANPVFENPASNNFHLLPGSPCIDTGSNTAFGLPPRDFERDLRILDGDDDGTSTVDMGVDEFTKKSDLIVESIVIDPVCPKPYEPYAVYVTIKNRGTKNIPGLFPYLPFQCAFNSGSKPFSLWQTWNVFGLDAGETTIKQFDFPDGRAADSYTLGAIADYGNKMAESDENNNYSNVPLIVDLRAFETILYTANASKWFGGDDRVGSKPRNIGVGQSFNPQGDCHVNSVGFRFLSRFDYYQNPTGQGHEVTLVLNTMYEDGTIIGTEEKTVSAGFDGGWINFDLTANLEAGKKYIFTCYLKDGEIIEYGTTVRGYTEDLLPYSRGYSGEISVYGGDIEDWSNWDLHFWDFNFRISGIYSNICEGDFDEDSDVDGSDLAVFAVDFGRTDCGIGEPCKGDFDRDKDLDGSDLAVFAADFGRTDCPR